jgi:quinoprotein glucose dehydrogenase
MFPAKLSFMRMLILCLAVTTAFAADPGWTAYGHDPGGTRYSPLKQIDRTNVANLRPAWTYRTGALDSPGDANKKAAFEATPILIDATLFLTTPFNVVIALDPVTGREKWKFDPKLDRTQDFSEVTSRGVGAWQGPRGELLIFEGTLDGRLLALDGNTGKLAWQTDLTKDVNLRDRGNYQVTSAPAVVGDLVITGSSIGDNRAVDVERGIVRAFEVRTGKLRWTWDPIPWANKQTLRTGAANAWGTLSADPARDLLFIPTGSASPDYYGGQRPGDNRHANSVVALKASTGELQWSFQVVHHDLWDYDVAGQPALIDFAGKPAVAVTTKMGLLFVLDRVTGKPLHMVEERAVPKSDIPGEDASPTQPVPTWAPMVPQRLTADDLWGATEADRAACRERLAKLRNDGPYTPPSLQGSLAFPGNVGGVNWGGSAWDPERELLFSDTNRLAAIFRIIPRAELRAAIDQVNAEKAGRFSGEFARQTGTPYAMYRTWLASPSGLPCNPPPWGALVAFDLKTGKVRWETPIGEVAPGVKGGSPNLGGPMATAGGLVFTAAGMDTALRAFDVESGKELWKVELPASAQATPMTFEAGGNQYVVICAGGHGKLGTKMGDSVVAFRLP